jgi:hypothetical protein
MNMTVTFSEKELEEIIKEKLNRDGFETDGIKIILESQWTGFGPNERSETKFKHIEAKISKKKEIDNRYKQFENTTYFDR